MSTAPSRFYYLSLFLLPMLAVAESGGQDSVQETDPFTATRAAELPDDDALQAMGAVVGQIRLERLPIFDTTKPAENKALYRAANQLHKLTRASVVRGQLLFSPGDPYDPQLLEESERILRNNAYLYDARVLPVAFADGVVDIVVTTRDVWTLKPQVSASRAGGANRTKIGLEDQNFLGSGALFGFELENDVDRDSKRLVYSDRQIGRHWLALDASYAHNSDGALQYFRIQRPFYALDTRWAAGFSVLSNDREDTLYELGDEVVDYRNDEQHVNLWYGWSRGLKAGWTKRWRAGLVSHDKHFSPPADLVRSGPLPDDRKLVYPYVSVELLEDRFAKTRNHDLVDRTEDFYLGKQLTAGLGWAGDSLGSDRNAWLLWGSAQQSFGHPDARVLLLHSEVSGRLESGDVANGLVSTSARYYVKQSRKRLLFVSLSAAKSLRLDLDNPLLLGGDNGLRGYPIRYQSGTANAVFTIEQRYFTDWYPWRLVRIGGALFADVGRTWGDAPTGGENLGLLRDIGFGLRLAPTRGGAKVFHVDVAFPLDGDESIDSVQINVSGQRSF